jgi:phosphotransferase system HPr (HPr) family protein
VVHECETVVPNPQGLHVRPIMQIIDTLSRFDARVKIRAQDREADARNVLELLMLVATQGTRLKLEADGADAKEALDALAGLIASGFNEK